MALTKFRIAVFLALNAIGEGDPNSVTQDVAAALVEDDECHASIDASAPAECALELTQIRAAKLPFSSRAKIAALVDTAPSHHRTKKADVLSTTAEEAMAVVAKLEAERKQLFLKEMSGATQEAASDASEGGSHASKQKTSSAEVAEQRTSSASDSQQSAKAAEVSEQKTSSAEDSQLTAKEAEWKADFKKALASPKMTLSKANSKHQGASSTDASSSAETVAALGVDYGHPSWLPFCQKIFLDLGATLGVNARKVFEPKKYPNSTLLPILDAAIGNPGWRRADFSKTGLCVLGFEPNPAHQEHLEALEQAYEKQGWMAHYYNFAAWSAEGFMAFNASSERPSGEAEQTNAGAHLMMHATQQQQGEDDPALMVRTVDLAAFIHSLPRHKVDLMVMDIEGAEYETLARLIQRSLLCERHIRTAFVSTHDWGEILHWGKEGAFLNTTHPRSFTAVLERRDQLQGVRWCNQDNVSPITELPDDSNYTQDVDSSFAQLSSGMYSPAIPLAANSGRIDVSAPLSSLQNGIAQPSSLLIPQAVSSLPHAQALASQLSNSQVGVASMEPATISATQTLPFQLRRIPTQLSTAPTQGYTMKPTSMLGAPAQAAQMQAAPMKTLSQNTLPLTTPVQAIPSQTIPAQTDLASQA